LLRFPGVNANEISLVLINSVPILRG